MAGGAMALAIVGASLVSAQPAAAATTTITVTFSNWRCNATGGGKIVAVQMGSQYGSVPKTKGKTIKIKAKTNAKNSLTGAVWCKRPWHKGGIVTPVYNIKQGLWVSKPNQKFTT